MQSSSAEKGSAIVIAVIILAIVGVAGFFLLKSSKQASPTSSQTQSYGQAIKEAEQTSGSAKSTPENLTFSGTVNGNMTSGVKGDTYVCLVSTMGPIVGKIGDKDYTFEYRSLGAKDPGTYKAYAQIGPVDNKDLYFGGDVNLTVNSDKRSGMVDGTLANLKDSSQTVKISGSYTCPPDF